MAREKSARLTPNKIDLHKGAMFTPLYAKGVGHLGVDDGTPANATPARAPSNDHLPAGGKLLKSRGGK